MPSRFPFIRPGLAGIVSLAMVCVALIGAVDYLSGFELSVNEFYLAPVALAAWYQGRLGAVIVAVGSCLASFVADFAAGLQHSHEAITAWNLLVNLGFLVISGLVLSALRRSYDAQRRLASQDALTGLPSRRVFEERLQLELLLARRQKSSLTVAYLDLDNFKQINDASGHHEGDRVLRQTGQTLQRMLRASDTISRLGGDEFGLILPETDADGARRLVSMLNSALRQLFRQNEWKLGCSIGVVTVPDGTLPAEQLVAAADALMYRVKKQGKGSAEFETLQYNIFDFGRAPRAPVADSAVEAQH